MKSSQSQVRMILRWLVSLAPFLLLAIAVPSRQPAEPLGSGTYQAEDVALELPVDAHTLETGNAQENMALQTTYARFNIAGNRVEMRWQGQGEIISSGKEAVVQKLASDNQWQQVAVQASQFQDGPFSFWIRAYGEPVLIDTLVVYSYSDTQAWTWIRRCIIPMIAIILFLVRMVWKRSQAEKQDAS